MKPVETHDSEFLKARRIVERLLKFRLRSEFEVAAKLRQQRISSTTIDRTIDHYRRLGILNDTLFVRGWIASRVNKPFGKRRIRRELIQKGVSAFIIEQEMARGTSGYDELQAARALAEKRIRQYGTVSVLKKKQRLYRHLCLRGFDPEIIYKVLGEVSDDPMNPETQE